MRKKDPLRLAEITNVFEGGLGGYELAKGYRFSRAGLSSVSVFGRLASTGRYVFLLPDEMNHQFIKGLATRNHSFAFQEVAFVNRTLRRAVLLPSLEGLLYRRRDGLPKCFQILTLEEARAIREGRDQIIWDE